MKPLDGITVLDLTHVFAGPFCTYQLAVLGANVIKIESPSEPDMMRLEGVVATLSEKKLGTNFIAQNAGKRSLSLNLQSTSGQSVLKKMLVKTDVLVQNFSGGAIEKMGLGPDVLTKINSKLIYCSITGFGKTGPKSEHPAYDNVIQAFSGLMSVNGNTESQPLKVGPPVVDYGTGAQAAMAICAALFAREKMGKGQIIDVSMLDAALILMCSSTTDTLANGRPPAAYGNAHPLYAGYAAYQTAEGLLMIGAWTNKQLSRLFRVFGENARANEIDVTPRAKISQYYKKDAEIIARNCLLRSADEWEELLNDARVPAARVRTIDEALRHSQIFSRELVQRLGHYESCEDATMVLGKAFSLSEDDTSALSLPPLHGEHTDRILQEFGISLEEIQSFRASGVI